MQNEIKCAGPAGPTGIHKKMHFMAHHGCRQCSLSSVPCREQGLLIAAFWICCLAYIRSIVTAGEYEYRVAKQQNNKGHSAGATVQQTPVKKSQDN
jgi:hypothetical protein